MIKYILTDGKVSVSNNKIVISNATNTIQNNEISENGIEINEDLCTSQSLNFGEAVASELEVNTCSTLPSLLNVVFNVYRYESEDLSTLEQLGVYKVYKDEPTANKKDRRLVMYDKLCEIINADVASWYNGIFPENDTTVSLSAMRSSFFAQFGVTQESVSLCNDSVRVKKTIQPEKLSGQVVLEALGEVNGAFPRIARNGKATWVRLGLIEKGTLPSITLYPNTTLKPKHHNGSDVKTSAYEQGTLTCETFDTTPISRVQIRQEEGDIGATVGSSGNDYVVQGNFLCFGMTQNDLTTVATNLLNQIRGISYMPFSVKAVGNLNLHLGDRVHIIHKGGAVDSYILNRTFHGTLNPRDEYRAKGTLKYGADVNGVNSELFQLLSKYMKIDKSVNGLVVTVGDSSEGLVHEVSVTASELASEITRAKGAESSLSSSIQQTAESISAKVSQSGGTKASFGWELTSTAHTWYANDVEVMKVNASGLEVSGKITASTISGSTITNTSDTLGTLNISNGGINNTKGDYSCEIYGGMLRTTGGTATIQIGYGSILIGSDSVLTSSTGVSKGTFEAYQSSVSSSFSSVIDLINGQSTTLNSRMDGLSSAIDYKLSLSTFNQFLTDVYSKDLTALSNRITALGG